MLGGGELKLPRLKLSCSVKGRGGGFHKLSHIRPPLFLVSSVPTV